MSNALKTAPEKSRAGNSIFDWPGTISEPMSWLRNEIDRIFDDFGRPARSALTAPERAMVPAPALELVENDKDYRLTAELPGMDGADIDISVADGVLTLSGEKKIEREEKDKGFLLSERRYGSFQRRVTLPSDVDSSAITARFKNGVLNVTLGKDEKAARRARKIDIKND